jgi:tetratricopeptide (TPR) repeat protein
MLLTLPRSAARALVILIMAVCASACSRAAPTAAHATAQPTPSKSAQRGPTKEPHASKKESSYTPPTAEEMAPLRPEYLAELAKIHEPPEMAGKPMQARNPAPPSALKLMNVMDAIGDPEKATHQQRSAAIDALLELAKSEERGDGMDDATIYGGIATLACIDGVDPRTVIEYTNNAAGDSGDLRALRARMYLKAGERGKALDALEEILAAREGHELGGGDADPRKESAPCKWSVADFDALGNDPRALAAKGLYLSSFIPYNAEAKGTVKESDIRDLYARSAASWHSPIPHFLAISLGGFGSEHSVNGARCLRANIGGGVVPEIVSACARYDDETRREIRELTMALVIEPTFAPALSARASKYLALAQGSYADGKPSRKLFELAINDFTAAIAARGNNKHELYCDRALALASIGKYQDAAQGYVQGMKYAKNGIEDSPFVYEQLANVYTKLGRFNEAADIITQAIMNASGGGMDVAIFGGGIKAFRTLYPEYDLLPDEILAEAVRRRYEPQFPQSWDASFISEGGAFNGKIASSILPELYVMRGDAYMKAGRGVDALSDYRRVKSDAWAGEERLLPRHLYFDERGNRNYDLPEPRVLRRILLRVCPALLLP